MSLTDRTKQRRSPAARPFIAVLALACWAPSARAELSCDAMPVLEPASVVQNVEQDAQEKVEAIRKTPRTDQRRFVLSERQELRAKYPQVDKPLLDSFLMWTTCQSINEDKHLSPSQAFDEYSQLYRLLSEPIKAPAHSE